jgi:hypothetical protein
VVAFVRADDARCTTGHRGAASDDDRRRGIPRRRARACRPTRRPALELLARDPYEAPLTARKIAQNLYGEDADLDSPYAEQLRLDNPYTDRLRARRPVADSARLDNPYSATLTLENPYSDSLRMENPYSTGRR